MGKFANVALIVAAVALIMVGVAAQTGTISPGGRGAPPRGAVAGSSAIASPETSPSPSASPSPTPSTPQPVPAPVATVQGRGEKHGHGHGHGG